MKRKSRELSEKHLWKRFSKRHKDMIVGQIPEHTESSSLAIINLKDFNYESSSSLFHREKEKEIPFCLFKNKSLLHRFLSCCFPGFLFRLSR